MRRAFIISLFGLLPTISMMAQGGRLRWNEDFDWTFTQNGKTVRVDLPHDWDIYAGPNSGKGATGTGGGWYEGGIGEYRKKLQVESLNLKDELLKLHFEGVYQKAEVFINGQKAGQHGYGYTPFTIDITPYINKDKGPNELVVRVNNSQQPNCRWYSGSGIYRHVWLNVMPKVHIAENGIFVTTDLATDGVQKAKVDVKVTVENEDKIPHTATVKVEEQEQTVSLNAGERKDIDFSYIIDHPHLWSPDDPYLYSALVSLNREQQESVSFGIRRIRFDAHRGFTLNGKPVLINGACLHHDDGVLGAMAFDAAEIRKVRLMKEAGFNLIRTSHNPPSRAFLDACDSIGMLVIDEAFDGWRSSKTTYDYSTLIDSCYREDIHAMVMRDRNHPCIISWSIGNEVIERKDLRVVTTARQLKAAVLECDPTRPVTEALCAWDNDWEIYDPHFEVLDIGGYNYMIHKHATDHQRDPQRVMWQTESYPRDAFRNWATVADNSYVVGDIVWTGLDYLGESGIGRYYYEGDRPGEHYANGGQPEWHGAYCGDVDITGWRKPISHYRQILWSTPLPLEGESEGAYIAVREPDGYHGKIRTTAWSVWPTWESWTWPGWEGKSINVEVYTKEPEVTLYLNNKEIGRKAVNRTTEYKAVFTIPYQPGTLRAEAGGNKVVLETAGTPAKLKLTADRRSITADGQDLAFITIEVIDRQGHICPEAAIPCQVNVSGSGSLLAAASADLMDTEPYTSPRVTTWKGRAIIVVRSAHRTGQAKVSVKSTLPTATISIAQTRF
ncbi:MAG: DUF4982 domain-containing protein [Bacteroidaceae bacterium]|nr:DUF4982 domain-containing protein [Bacteroidaceae bacterium]